MFKVNLHFINLIYTILLDLKEFHLQTCFSDFVFKIILIRLEFIISQKQNISVFELPTY